MDFGKPATDLNRDARGSERAAERTAPVSVVVPCYRCRSTIHRTVASIAVQTVRPLEAILVDDASGDGTLAELERIRDELGAGWVRIIALPANGGPSVARNAGWDAARGKYVAFLDADDAWHPRKIERQFAFMEAHPEVALCGHLSRQIRGSEPFEPDPLTDHVRRISRFELLASNRFSPRSAMLRRDLPFRFRPDRRYMEDQLLWLQILYAGLSVVRLEEVLAYTFKAPFGEAGLSGHLVAMESAELANYRQLFNEGKFGRLTLTALWAWSCLKFVRRVALVAVRKALASLPSRSSDS